MNDQFSKRRATIGTKPLPYEKSNSSFSDDKVSRKFFKRRNHPEFQSFVFCSQKTSDNQGKRRPTFERQSS